MLNGQILLIICFIFYLIWWYRGFRPGVDPATRLKGLNALLLAITATTGVAGIILSIGGTPISLTLLISGIVAYILLHLITRFVFNRAVTSELFLIVVWTMVEIHVVNNIDLSPGFMAVIALAFIASMVCYVAYYKMEEMAAFYLAMAPLVIGIVTMAALVIIAS